MKPLTITPARAKQLIADLGSDKAEVWKAAFEEFKYYDPRLAIDLVKLMDQLTDSPARQRLVAALSIHDPAALEGKDVQIRSIGAEGYNFTGENRSWWAEHRVDRINVGAP